MILIGISTIFHPEAAPHPNHLRICPAYGILSNLPFPINLQQLIAQIIIIIMSDPSIMSHMFFSTFGAGKHENGASVLPLPLNLIALIISYVCIKQEQAHTFKC